jgi:hypothetical protein
MEITTDGGELLEDVSNWFILGSRESRALALYIDEKLLVVENDYAQKDENGNTSDISEITLSLYEAVDDSLKVNKLGECSFETSLTNYSFSLNDKELTVLEQLDWKATNNIQILPECQQLADLIHNK